jgi:indolepyruvate ferredoxin oxidoreductase beta subunit
MKNKTDIIFTGCGGQGVITAARITAEVLLESGYDVKQSEIHGMSQREGSVDSHVRAGEKVYSPKIMRGQADYLLGLEMLEAYRWRDFLNKDSLALVNTKQIEPVPVKLGSAEYPRNIAEEMKGICKTVTVDCSSELQKIELMERLTSVYMVGLLSGHLYSVDKKIWYSVLKERFSGKSLDDNIKAFNAGRNYSLQ